MSKCSTFLSHLETAVEALNAANAAKGFEFAKKDQITTAAHAGDQIAKDLTDILLAIDTALEKLAETAREQGVKASGSIGDASAAFFTAGRAVNAALKHTAKATDAAHAVDFPAINK
jgi:ABC-type transporter Mla subunit MlaD